MNNLGSLLPDDQALEYLRKQFVLSAKAQGRIGKFYQVKEVKYRGTDQEYIYEEPVDVAYHLVETPTRQMLTRLGWFVENQTNLPILLFITFYDMNNNEISIDEGAIIEVTAKRTIKPKDLVTEQFKITELQTDLELNQCVCKVTPVRLEQKENVHQLADKKDPVNENKYLKRHIYYDEGEEETM